LKIFLSLLVIPILILAGSQAFGQQISMGVPPHEVLKVTIDETGTAHVTHVINSTIANFKPIQVDTISGNLDNLTVTDASGNPVEYGKMQKTPLSIIINASQRNETLIKYNLVNVVTNTDGVWKWDYWEPQDTDFTAFHFPKGVDMVWANGRPVYLGDLGLGQHGNGFKLQYVINEPQTIQTVQVEGKSVAVGIRTVLGLGNDYAFDKSLLAYSFNVNKANIPITVIIPQDLLSGPYAVTVNGHPELHQEFHYNSTHAWIGFEPTKSGTVQITGTVGGQGQQTGTSQSGASSATIGGEQIPTTGSSDNTSIYLLIGSIIAAGIAGIIIVKKTRTKTPAKP
jgi:LPXTG-motif cell wall-anchored protein